MVYGSAIINRLRFVIENPVHKTSGDGVSARELLQFINGFLAPPPWLPGAPWLRKIGRMSVALVSMKVSMGA
jgi:hypothetical protein